MSDGARACGVTWHVEMNGEPFPFSRGASFVRVDGEGRITYVRDIPEPATKPGGAALSVLSVAAALLRLRAPASRAATGPRALPPSLPTACADG